MCDIVTAANLLLVYYYIVMIIYPLGYVYYQCVGVLTACTPHQCLLVLGGSWGNCWH